MSLNHAPSESFAGMECLTREHDWSATPIGSRSAWPQSLRTTVDIVQASPLAMVVLWGPDLVQVYNDGYADICGRRHPSALGQRTRDCWPEVWAFNAPIYQAVFRGESRSFRDQKLTIERLGPSEEAWFDLTYSPVRGEDDEVAGVIVTVVETTTRLLADRRLAAERDRQRRQFEQAPGFVCISAGPEHVYEFGNAAYARAIGRHDFVGKTVREALPDIEGQGFYELLDGVYATGVRHVAEHIPVRMQPTLGADPEIRYLDFIYEPVVDDAGRITGIFTQGYDVTDAHHAREALRASESRQAFLLALGDETRDLLDPKDVMAAAARLLGSHLDVACVGYSEPDAAGERVTIEHAWTAPDAAAVQGTHRLDDYGPAMVAALRSGRTLKVNDVGLDAAAATHAGSYASLDVRAFVAAPLIKGGRFVAFLFVAADDVRGWTDMEVAIIEDVAERTWAAVERARTEERLRNSQARIAAILSQAYAGVATMNATGHFTFVNDRYCEMLGRSRAVLLATGMFAVTHPDDLAVIRLPFLEAAAGGPAFQCEKRYVRPDFTVLWVRKSVTGIRDANGAFQSMLAVSIDISDRKAVEVALRDSEENLRNLNADLERRVAERTRELGRTWRVSPDLLSIIGRDGRFKATNPAWRDALGWEEADLVETALHAIVHPEDVLPTEAALDAATRGEPALHFESRCRGRDGAYRWLQWVAVSEGDKLYSSARDITTEKRRVEALQQAEEHMRQSQKLEAVGQLTGGVAHDFNNLLTIIQSSVDFLRRPDLPEARRVRYVNAISDTVRRASALTSQLLAFARRQPLNPSIFDAGAQVRSVVDLIRPLMGTRVEIACSVAYGQCHVEVDRSQFETAVVNLSVNARDAMDGEGHLTIALTHVRQVPAIRSHPPIKGSFVALSITDDGAGIPPSQIAKIFEPFFTTKEVGKGTGLGLSQVFGFAKQSGGEIEVASEVGRGTTFTLYLPLVSSPVDVTEPLGEVLGRAGVDEVKSVLIVEDNEAVGSFAAEMLDAFGFVTRRVGNAAEALDILGEPSSAIDVVFSDVILPGMSGLEMARIIRERHSGLPVILTSGYSDVIARDGHDGFELVPKPYSIDTLSRVLRQAIVGA